MRAPRTGIAWTTGRGTTRGLRMMSGSSSLSPPRPRLLAASGLKGDGDCHSHSVPEKVPLLRAHMASSFRPACCFVQTVTYEESLDLQSQVQIPQTISSRSRKNQPHSHRDSAIIDKFDNSYTRRKKEIPQTLYFVYRVLSTPD